MFSKVRDEEKKAKEISFDSRVEAIEEEYEVKEEGRDRRFEYKTECIPAASQGNMTGLDTVLNHETEDGWRLVERVDAQEFGRGIKPGVIFVFERPVKEGAEEKNDQDAPPR